MRIYFQGEKKQRSFLITVIYAHKCIYDKKRERGDCPKVKVNGFGID